MLGLGLGVRVRDRVRVRGKVSGRGRVRLDGSALFHRGHCAATGSRGDAGRVSLV